MKDSSFINGCVKDGFVSMRQGRVQIYSGERVAVVVGMAKINRGQDIQQASHG